MSTRLPSHLHLAARPQTNYSLLLPLAALCLGLTVPAPAQNRPLPQTVPEKHFTIPPEVRTPVVLQTEPDAACDLHPAGVNDPAQTMRLYGNIEGYVRFHFTPQQAAQDAYLQLDCTAQEAMTTHPLHLRIAASPIEDMPAPASSIPTPAGSKIRPALTDEIARQLSDQEIVAQGYPPRPDGTKSPAAYSRWLGLVSRPMTILPPHSVSRSDISHPLPGVTEGPSNNSHWSGFADTGPALGYTAVSGEWSVPSVSSSCTYCYSSVWAGLDGVPPSGDVVQAGTEQDSVYMGSGTATNYYAWTEAYPQQPTAHQVFSVSPGDQVFVFVYVGDSSGAIDPLGNYAWFMVQDPLAVEMIITSTKLGKSFGFLGTSAEWIVERPFVDGGFPELSDYGSVKMIDANFVPLASTLVVPYSEATDLTVNPFAPAAQIQQITMTGSDTPPWYDWNVLSAVSADTHCSTCMTFSWKAYH